MAPKKEDSSTVLPLPLSPKTAICCSFFRDLAMVGAYGTHRCIGAGTRRAGIAARAAPWKSFAMCRNIRPLHNFEPEATSQEVHDAALQYVRKVSGMTKPSQANTEVFDRAVAEIAHATEHLLAELVTSAPPKDREVEREKARARAAKRFATSTAS